MSGDKELEAIRNKRMQELQSMQGQHQQQEEMQQQQQQAINGLLNQVLDQQARARLNTIMVAKPEKGRQMESIIVQMATSGQIGGRLSENDLISLVERVNAQTQKTTSVKFDRRRAALDDDGDW
ncbi:programmed cell death protein 5-like [Homarus americanus]|uniref:Programmed cell death protein 5-like n=1 Tax=Homarus americanus TaxID=6706 RepID=A0A8J5JK46_HOMAM|nr:programmed cell death protein 5-like [Homarus americanus]KAG7157526.1 programmed cell death protein 5-like [Homarus americanus]